MKAGLYQVAFIWKNLYSKKIQNLWLFDWNKATSRKFLISTVWQCTAQTQAYWSHCANYFEADVHKVLFSYFSHFCDQIAVEKQPEVREFTSAYRFRGCSPLWWGKHGGSVAQCYFLSFLAFSEMTAVDPPAPLCTSRLLPSSGHSRVVDTMDKWVLNPRFICSRSTLSYHWNTHAFLFIFLRPRVA